MIKPLNETPMSAQLIQTDYEIKILAKYFRRQINNRGDKSRDITGFVVDARDGDYTCAWYTTDSRPYLNTASYRRIL